MAEMTAMQDRLPTARELESLPMRAIVAYASRAARRLSVELRGIVAEDTVDHALQLIDEVSRAYLIGDLDAGRIIYAAHDVVQAFTAATVHSRSLNSLLAVFSIVDAAQAAVNTIYAAAAPESSRDQLESAAKWAQRAAARIRADEHRTAAAKALCRDYELLRGQYGEHEEVIIGDPVDCFDDDP